jgi:hypothetical protein
MTIFLGVKRRKRKHNGIVGQWKFDGQPITFARFEGITLMLERLDELKRINNRELIYAKYAQMGEKTRTWQTLIVPTDQQ